MQNVKFAVVSRIPKKRRIFSTVNGDEVFCREGYTDAEGLLVHLENVGVQLAEELRDAARAKRCIISGL